MREVRAVARAEADREAVATSQACDGDWNGRETQ
jgi:hypothetical protein